MIISRAPVRISLGGGGTDLASYYSRFGGFLIYGAIGRYVYIAANARLSRTIRLSYSQTENVDNVEAIENRIFREALRMTGIQDSIELVSISDVPANCGLGTSGAFTVSLLNALHAYQREYVPLDELAEEACHLEIERLGEPIGKQDQYAATFGGVTTLTFAQDGTVTVKPVALTADCLLELERRIMLFFTGMTRKSSDILQEQSQKTEQNDDQVCESLHAIKEIGHRTLEAFEAGDLDAFGHMLHEHWMMKKKLSDRVSDAQIDEWYNVARRNGALGGKIVGAGGGGFLLLYCGSDRERLRRALEPFGLQPMPFRFDMEGAKIVANLRV